MSGSGGTNSSAFRKRITSKSSLLESAQLGRALGVEFRVARCFVKESVLECFDNGGVGSLDSAGGVGLAVTDLPEAFLSAAEFVLE